MSLIVALLALVVVLLARAAGQTLTGIATLREDIAGVLKETAFQSRCTRKMRQPLRVTETMADS
jgi:nicotinate-nucleotide pyrophosphorylase